VSARLKDRTNALCCSWRRCLWQIV